ncbi:MAG: LysE family translocator [Pseudomonadota bacterium]
MDWADILTFAVVAALLVISPGPNGLLLVKTVPTSGRAAGVANIAGFVSAFYLHGALSILGISILLVQSATAFAIVKFLGAAYLCWIGISALVDAYRGSENAVRPAPARSRRTLVRAFVEGFLTNALNPKVSMFYLAAFPQFIPAGEGSTTAAFLLVLLHSLINAVWFGVMILLFAQVTAMSRRGAFQRWVKAVTGIVFIGFGVKLATTRLTT